MIAAPLSTVSLRCGVAVRPATGCEEDCIGATNDLGHLVELGSLQVDHRRLGAVLLEVGDVLGAADHADGLMPGLGHQPAELPGDLSVATCDDDAQCVLLLVVISGSAPFLTVGTRR